MAKETKSMTLPDGRQLTWDEQTMGTMSAVMNGRINGELINDAELQKLIKKP